jgi:hypothetical protein
MCKKLIIICFTLAVVVFSVPASAASPVSPYNPLKVDIDGGGVSTPAPGWHSWLFASNWTGPVSKEFDMGGPPWENPIAELNVYRKNKTPNNTGFSRNRSGGFAAVGPNPLGEPIEYSPTGKGFGTNYVKLTITQLAPCTEYRFLLWSYERREVWSCAPANPDAKYGVWSTTNPKEWLDTHGYSGFGGEPNGYSPITPVPNPPTGASGMPAELAALVVAEGGRASIMAPLNDNNDFLGGSKYLVSFSATTDGDGTISIYGWIDPTDWRGAMHMPLNGFAISTPVSNEPPSPPTFEPDGGGYITDRTNQQVVIRCATSEATIHYTMNGLDPTEGDPIIESGGSVAVTFDPPTTLKAKAFQDDWTPSDVKTAVYYRSFIRYVSTSGSDDNNGLSWATAKRTVQAAIDVAQADDEIWVAAGTYLPTGTDDRTISFVMGPGVAIYGGFAGIETTRDQRNWVTNQTILSGDIGTQDNNSDNSYHVVVGANGATLDGFTITGGNANENDTDFGGGMHNVNSSPTVANCAFIGNSAYGGLESYGGGMGNDNSSPTVTNCTFSSNITNFGGGMGNIFSSHPIVTNCTFSGNSATYAGGGMGNHESSNPTVTNCTFTDNSAYNDSGGGMYNETDCSPIVTGCAFSGNSAAYGGGGMENTCGMDNEPSNPIVTNCTFSQNSAYYGGGMDNYGSSPIVINCTFTTNSASDSGGGMDNYQSSPMVTNNIFWSNTATNGPQIYDDDLSSSTVAYSDVQDGWAGAGTGNINADPYFVGSGNYRLLSGSPCIDAGNNNSVPLDYADLDSDGSTTEPIPFDLDGFERFIDDLCTTNTGNGTSPIVDMGAYEFLRSNINHDGAVNFEDFAIFALQWLETDCGECCGAELTCDGQVNWADLRELTKWWLAGTAP